MIDIKAIAERHYENFADKCDANKELHDLVCDYFSEPFECPYEICFDKLYNWDADLFVSDPIKCINNYLSKK